MRSDIMAQAQAIRATMDANQQIADLVDAAGGISVTVEQSDKLGFNWRVYAVNNVVVRKDYEAQETPVGVADNPFVWTEDHKLIPNGYYIHGGTVKVWTGDYGVSAAWELVPDPSALGTQSNPRYWLAGMAVRLGHYYTTDGQTLKMAVAEGVPVSWDDEAYFEEVDA